MGNGESIKVWNDPWLSCSTPETPIGHAAQSNLSLRVKDLLCPLDNSWDIAQIRLHLPQYEDTILKIITSSTQATDTLVWLPEKSGSYTTKTGYGIASSLEINSIMNCPEFDWLKHIWNVKTSPKVKDFLWKVINKAIPVSTNLARRGIPEFRCKRCGGEEDDLHTFISCPLAAAAWELAPVAWQPDSLMPSLATLLTCGNRMVALPPVGLYVPLWPWILWNLWKALSTLFFDNKSFTGEEVILKSIKDAKEWQEAQIAD